MIDLQKRKFVKYFLFSSLYFSEGLKWSIAVVIFPLYFDKLGISPTILGFVIAITGIPTMIKFLFGGIIDYFIRYGRKKFVLLGGITAASALFVIAFINPVDAIIPFTIVFFIGILGISFLDVSADAWAIEISKKEERGKVNGGMFAGLSIGMGVGSILLTQIAFNFSYSLVFISAGFLILSVIIIPLAIKEIKIIKKIKKMRFALIKEFKNKTVQIFCLFSPLVGIGGGILLIVIPLYLKNILMLNDAQIGIITAVFPIANILGSLLGGASTDIFGRKPTIYIVFLSSIIFSSLLIYADTWQILAIIYGAIGFLYGSIYASIGALAMDVTNPRLAGTQFSFYMSLLNIGEVGIGYGLAGLMLDILGYERVFLYAALFYGLALLVFYFVRIKKKNNTKDSKILN
jgi:MFS family permease